MSLQHNDQRHTCSSNPSYGNYSPEYFLVPFHCPSRWIHSSINEVQIICRLLETTWNAHEVMIIFSRKICIRYGLRQKVVWSVPAYIHLKPLQSRVRHVFIRQRQSHEDGYVVDVSAYIHVLLCQSSIQKSRIRD